MDTRIIKIATLCFSIITAMNNAMAMEANDALLAGYAAIDMEGKSTSEIYDEVLTEAIASQDDAMVAYIYMESRIKQKGHRKKKIASATLGASVGLPYCVIAPPAGFAMTAACAVTFAHQHNSKEKYHSIKSRARAHLDSVISSDAKKLIKEIGGKKCDRSKQLMVILKGENVDAARYDDAAEGNWVVLARKEAAKQES